MTETLSTVSKSSQLIFKKSWRFLHWIHFRFSNSKGSYRKIGTLLIMTFTVQAKAQFFSKFHQSRPLILLEPWDCRTMVMSPSHHLYIIMRWERSSAGRCTQRYSNLPTTYLSCSRPNKWIESGGLVVCPAPALDLTAWYIFVGAYHTKEIFYADLLHVGARTE